MVEILGTAPELIPGPLFEVLEFGIMDLRSVRWLCYRNALKISYR
jgi:hypothetical protein